MFNENSQALYRSSGSLVIDISERGYKFNVDIPGGKGDGIGKMKVFCFDMMLVHLVRTAGREIDFLIHDSMIYDGVDSRQRALALERVAAVPKESPFQYICTLNSDMVPYSDFSEKFDFEKYVRHRLTDKEPSGSLLGIRF